MTAGRSCRFPLGEVEGAITATAGRIVAYSTTDEFGELPDWSFDPATGAWTELPDDPLPLSCDRFMTWDGGALVLRAHKIVPNPSGDEPTLGAAFDPDKGRWRELPVEIEDAAHPLAVGGGTQSAEETGDALWQTLEHPPAGRPIGDGAFASVVVRVCSTYSPTGAGGTSPTNT